MIPVDRPDAPDAVSLRPPGEGRETGQHDLTRHFQPAALDGGTGLGQPQQAPSELESRPARMAFHAYSHDQQALYHDENDGGHVAIGRHPGLPVGEHEPSLAPQRPSFRTPPGTWTDTLTES